MKRSGITLLATAFASILSICAHALSPVDPDRFYESVSQSPTIVPGEWSGRGDLCMQKARETGYLMLWYLTALSDKNSVRNRAFLERDLCNKTFCNLINDYKYIILCCEDYGETIVKQRKNELYGYPEPKTIWNENTHQYEENHNGYPTHTQMTGGTWTWCDPPPSLHLLKMDSTGKILFHVCSGGPGLKYDTSFSPYANQFPIADGMGWKKNDKFAPWLKQYLDMYPASKQIEEYANSGGDAINIPSTQTISQMGTNYIYEVVEIAITETINPTVYQIALHRDNLLFRAVTSLGDILVKKRIYDTFTSFDDRILAANGSGRWFVNHDDTMSAIAPSYADRAELDIIPISDCTLDISQRVGNGFNVSGYVLNIETNITTDTVITESGTSAMVTTTNISYGVVGDMFFSTNVSDRSVHVFGMKHDCMYRIGVVGNATFDVLSAR